MAPASRNSHAISRSVQAVTAAMTAQMDQSSTLRPSVSFVSFWAERTMMPMTAAPMP
jgi:hypothetical protein